MTAYNKFIQEKGLKMVIKEGTFEANKVYQKRLTWVLCSFGSKLHPKPQCWTAGESCGRSALTRLLFCFVLSGPSVSLCLSLPSLHFSIFCLLPSVQVWFCGFLLDGFWACVSRDEAAVDAAGSQSPLQSSLLSLGSQDGDDGLVEHRLQALLGQR